MPFAVVRRQIKSVSFNGVLAGLVIGFGHIAVVVVGMKGSQRISPTKVPSGSNSKIDEAIAASKFFSFFGNESTPIGYPRLYKISQKSIQIFTIINLPD